MQRSTIELLPNELRDRIDAELIKRSFADYRGLTEWLNSLLAENGLELKLAKSAVHSYGQELEQRIAALKRSTQVAKTIAAEVGDDEGAMNEALQRLVQDKLFNAILDLEVDPETVDITKLGHLVADLGRASVQQKKFAAEVKRKTKEVAESVAASVRKGGLTAAAADKIRRDILGIAK